MKWFLANLLTKIGWNRWSSMSCSDPALFCTNLWHFNFIFSRISDYFRLLSEPRVVYPAFLHPFLFLSTPVFLLFLDPRLSGCLFLGIFIIFSTKSQGAYRDSGAYLARFWPRVLIFDNFWPLVNNIQWPKITVQWTNWPPSVNELARQTYIH